ncbi:MAG: MoaD/ThiS family protein [Acidobacteriota bacterium]
MWDKDEAGSEKAMTVKVKFLTSFRDLFGGRERDVSLPEKALLRQLLVMLCDTPERRTQVFTGRDELSPYVVVMKNGLPVQSLGGLEALLEHGDTIAIFPFLGGG